MPDWPDPIPGVIPFGGIALFSAAAGAGKTIFISDWCRRWTLGLPINGYPTHPPTAFCYIAADRPWHPVYADTFGVVNLDIPHYSLADDPGEKPEDWRPEDTFKFIIRVLNKAEPSPGALVIIDPVAPLLIYGNQNDPKHCARTMHFYRRQIQERQITLLCTANIVKQKNDPAERHTRPQDRMAGSGALAAHSDTQMWIIDDGGPDDPVYFGWKPRRGPVWRSAFVFNAETKLFEPHTRLEDVGDIADRTIEILALLPQTGLRFTAWCDLAVEKLGISRRTFQNHLSKLSGMGYIHESEDRCYYRRKPS